MPSLSYLSFHDPLIQRRTLLAMCTGLMSSLAALCLGALPLEAARADPETGAPNVGTEAHPCIGFLPDRGAWGNVSSQMWPGTVSCPDGWAVISAERGSGTSPAPRQVEISGACCPMPEGMLTGEAKLAEESCPDGWVVVGVSIGDPSAPDAQRRWDERAHYIECRALDATRFRLGPDTTGWEVGARELWFGDRWWAMVGKPVHHIAWSRLPTFIRFAMGRSSLTRWQYPSCIGMPFGSVLTGKRGKRCNDIVFRQVLDAKTGTPAPIFPRCDAVSDPYDPDARCIVNNQ